MTSYEEPKFTFTTSNGSYIVHDMTVFFGEKEEVWQEWHFMSVEAIAVFLAIRANGVCTIQVNVDRRGDRNGSLPVAQHRFTCEGLNYKFNEYVTTMTHFLTLYSGLSHAVQN